MEDKLCKKRAKTNIFVPPLFFLTKNKTKKIFFNEKTKNKNKKQRRIYIYIYKEERRIQKEKNMPRERFFKEIKSITYH